MNDPKNSKDSAAVRIKRVTAFLAACALTMLLAACMVGPNYHRPTTPTTPSFKEIPPPQSAGGADWKQATPSDQILRGKWWEIFNDSQLNAIEEQVNVSNQNVLTAAAQYRAAVDAITIARSNLWPVVNATVSSNTAHTGSSSSSTEVSTGTRSNYNANAGLSWTADVWGNLRRQVTANSRSAQASYADLESARLASQSALAQAYFQLRAVEEQQQLLQRTVASYSEYRDLTQMRMNAGIASGSDVAQAETQLSSAQTSLTDLGISRAQLEHAIAVLTGKPPAAFSLANGKLSPQFLEIPVALPSTLLERRPDIAAAERRMASSNEQIGITQAAYYPTISLTATTGLQNTDPAQWFTWPSRFWSIGPQAVENLFSAGRRHAQVDQARALYDADVATYRQTTLTAFQQVEDDLASLHLLADEAVSANQAVQAAQTNLDISTYQYKAGTVSSLQVITAQTAALQAQVTAINIHSRRMVSSVLLVEALGGGWDTSKIPVGAQLKTTAASKPSAPATTTSSNPAPAEKP